MAGFPADGWLLSEMAEEQSMLMGAGRNASARGHGTSGDGVRNARLALGSNRARLRAALAAGVEFQLYDLPRILPRRTICSRHPTLSSRPPPPPTPDSMARPALGFSHNPDASQRDCHRSSNAGALPGGGPRGSAQPASCL